jgi:hypothetical protein
VKLSSTPVFCATWTQLQCHHLHRIYLNPGFITCKCRMLPCAIAHAAVARDSGPGAPIFRVHRCATPHPALETLILALATLNASYRRASPCNQNTGSCSGAYRSHHLAGIISLRHTLQSKHVGLAPTLQGLTILVFVVALRYTLLSEHGLCASASGPRPPQIYRLLSSHSGDRSAAVFPMSAERRYRLPLAPGIVIVQLLLSSGIAFLLAPSVVALSISLSADPQCRLYQHGANQGVPIMNTYRRSGLRFLPRCHRCIPAHPAIRAWDHAPGCH